MMHTSSTGKKFVVGDYRTSETLLQIGERPTEDVKRLFVYKNLSQNVE
jgi:hypothetical protein